MASVIPDGVPFAQIPHALIEDTTLAHTAVRVYCYLMRRTNDESRSWPGQRLIADEIGMSTATVAKAVKSLEDAGWVTVKRSRTEAGKQDVNEYVIHGKQRVPEIETGMSETETVNASPVSDSDTGVYQNLIHGVANSDTGGVANFATELHPVLTTPIELEEEAAAPQLAKQRQRDLLWESFVAIHGEPATDSERGKFNSAVKKLREAVVTPAEYPRLVAAFTSKHRGLQPAPHTIAARVGELRHYARRGPVQAIEPDELQRRRAFAQLEAEESRYALEENTK